MWRLLLAACGAATCCFLVPRAGIVDAESQALWPRGLLIDLVAGCCVGAMVRLARPRAAAALRWRVSLSAVLGGLFCVLGSLLAGRDAPFLLEDGGLRLAPLANALTGALGGVVGCLAFTDRGMLDAFIIAGGRVRSSARRPPRSGEAPRLTSVQRLCAVDQMEIGAADRALTCRFCGISIHDSMEYECRMHFAGRCPGCHRRGMSGADAEAGGEVAAAGR